MTSAFTDTLLASLLSRLPDSLLRGVIASPTLAGLLIEQLLKVSIVLLIALGALALLRSRSAALRHWLLSTAVISALAMPIASVLMPSWSVSLGGASASSAIARALGDTTQSTGDARVQIDAHPLDRVGRAADDASASTVRNDSSDVSRRTEAAARAPRTLFAAAIIVVWAIGVVVHLFLLLVGLGRLAWIGTQARRISETVPAAIRRANGALAGTQQTEAVLASRNAARAASARTPSIEWDAGLHTIAQDIADDCGVRRRVRLLSSAHPTLLVTWGFFRPVILLPRDAASWTTERLRIVLSHELAHIARGDWSTQLIAELLRIVAWPTPLTRIACHRLRAESELACDDVVLSRGVDAPAYATHLVALARALTQHRRERWSPALGMVRQSAFERRIRAMLNVRLNRAPLSAAARAAIALAFAAATLPLAALSASTQAAESGIAATVRNPMGTAVSGVDVTLTAADTQKAQQAKTDAAGRIELKGLPAGAYRVDIKHMGFKPFEEQLTFAPGKRVEREFKLTLGTVQETIMVRGATTGAPKMTPPDGPLKAKEPRADKPLDPPTKLRHVSPVYPQSAYEAGKTGTVNLLATIAKDGTVSGVKVVKSVSPELDKAAMDAVRGWRYSPTTLNGVAVATEMTVTITFEK